MGRSKIDVSSSNAAISTHACDWRHHCICHICQVLLVIKEGVCFTRIVASQAGMYFVCDRSATLF